MIEGKFEAPVCCSQVPAWFFVLHTAFRRITP
jgi:hypothetical protein